MLSLLELLVTFFVLIQYAHMRLYTGEADAILEPPNCMYNLSISELGQTLVIGSSYPNSTYNQPGECQLNIRNTKYYDYGLLYTFHQLGPYINDCSAEIQFMNIKDDLNTDTFLEIYDCDNLHQNRLGRSDVENTSITVRRSYITLRRDFFFKLNVTVVRTKEIFNQRADQLTAVTLYCIVALNFMIPTAIFFTNECVKKRRHPVPEDDVTMRTDVADVDMSLVSPVNSAAGSLYNTRGQRDRFKTAEKQLQLFPFYKKLDKLEVGGKPASGNGTRSRASRYDSKLSTIEGTGSDPNAG